MTDDQLVRIAELLGERNALDYYLVLTGPSGAAMSSVGGTRPCRIDNVYLFDARQLLHEQRTCGVKVGVASSVPNRYWSTAEIYPTASSPLLEVTSEQAALLRHFMPQ